MEESRFEDLCVDSIWQIFFLQANYYNKKATLINYLYGEVVKQLNITNPTLSLQAKTILLENNLIKPMSACKQAALKCITASTVVTTTKIADNALNERGFARLSVLSNVNAYTYYSPKGNKNIYLALANALRNFDLNGTQFQGQGVFEVVVNYLNKHTMLQSATPKSIANSFFTQIEMQNFVRKLNQSFDIYLDTLLAKFKSDLSQQHSDLDSINVIYDIRKEVDASFNMFSSNFNSVISANIPQKVLKKYQGN